MEFTSTLEIDQKVVFEPMERQREKYKISGDKLSGTIIAVRFTKAKVFYDIIDEYWGILFRDVDSIKVNPELGRNNIDMANLTEFARIIKWMSG